MSGRVGTRIFLGIGTGFRGFRDSRDCPGFSRESGFPKVSGFVLLGLTDVSTLENQQCFYTFSY